MWLARLRAAVAIATEPVAIESLRNWVIEEDRIIERERDVGFCARQFLVVARQREVPSWDQPLIDSGTCGRVLLLCQLRDNVLQFLVGASYEIGFLEGVQLSATIVVPPGREDSSLSPACSRLLDVAGSDPGSTLIASCMQSEEGGRFYQDENRYEIVMLDAATLVPPSDEHQWMTLSQVMALKSVPGVLAIELRCVLVLLLKFL
jgi:oxidase EvaA